jgi:phosphate transport system substrate-binding protein
MNRSSQPLILAGRLLGLLLLVVFAAPCLAADNKPVKLTGAGASFAAPLYFRWFRDFSREQDGVVVDYQSTSTSGGVRDLIDGRIDFAGSDLHLGDEQVARIPDGVFQVPFAAGGIAVIYSLDDIPELRLSREALAGIYLGTIQRWNDPKIERDNPDVTLPDLPITVIARSDSSGTTFKFSRYLTAISPAFAEEVGTTMTPNWPDRLKQAGHLVRGRGNAGVAANVRLIPASIGYVQYAYGFLPGIHMAALQNQAGRFVAPGKAGFDAALDSPAPERPLATATDPVGEGAYPIIALSWLILRKSYDDPAKLPALRSMIEYGLGPGQSVAERLGYVRLPQHIVDYVQAELR